MGAAIGGPVEVIAGALIGNQLMGQYQKQIEQQRQLDANQAEIERLRKENERFRHSPSDRVNWNLGGSDEAGNK